MFAAKVDKVRENRIANEILVDAYEPEEIAMGWYYYLQEKLSFPFQAQWGSRKSSDRIVTVLEMSSEDDCLNDIYVEVLYRKLYLCIVWHKLWDTILWIRRWFMFAGRVKTCKGMWSNRAYAIRRALHVGTHAGKRESAVLGVSPMSNFRKKPFVQTALGSEV